MAAWPPTVLGRSTRACCRASPACARSRGCRTGPTSRAWTSRWSASRSTRGRSFRPGARFGPEAIRSASALLRPYNPAWDIDLVEALAIVDYGDLPVAPGDTIETYRRVEAALAPDRRARASSRSRSAATTRSRSPSSGCSPGGTGRSPSSSSTRTRTRGTSTSARSTSTGRRSCAPARRGCVDASASVQAGMRGTVYGPEDLEQSRAPRLHRPHDGGAARARARGLRGARARAGRRPSGLRHVRRGLPRPRRRARRRGHPRSAASRPPRRSRSSARSAGCGSSARTSSRWRPRTTAPASRRRSLAANVAWEMLALHASGRT